MAKLILVHESPRGRQILLNFEQIEYAHIMQLQSGSAGVTEVRMTNDHIHHLQESLDDLIGLCRGGED